MKNYKIWISSILFAALFFMIPTVTNAFGCTQSHTDCQNDRGLQLMCSGPFSDATCYSGGCGDPVTIVMCVNPGNEE